MPRTRDALDIAIIGAGASGLAAAREISQAGHTAVVIEARDRVGGRIHTIHEQSAGSPVELGAEFVHGEPAGTLRIVSAAHLQLDQIPDSHLQSVHGELRPVRKFWDRMQSAIDQVAKTRRSRGDVSLRSAVAGDRLSSSTRRMLLDFVEGYHAANPDIISWQSLTEVDDESSNDAGNKQFRVANGYDALLAWLQAGFDPERVTVTMNVEAVAIEWKRGHVLVRRRSALGRDLDPLEARCAIVTVPAPVLKAGGLRFDPELPAKQAALDTVATASVFKVVFQFREQFWRNDLTFLHASDSPVPTWWSLLPAREARLTGWAGGPKAEALLVETVTTRVDRALDALAMTLHIPRRRIDELLDRWWTHDWSSDPFSRGAYSYVAVNGMNRQRRLARPIEGTLFFAGEATETDEMATVGGALASGRRAGLETVKRIRR